MPFKSKAQQRYMFAAESRGEIPKGTARRWAHHTKDMKKLPEKKTEKKSAEEVALEKQAFVAAFIDGCARAGVTDPVKIAELAEKFARSVSEEPTTKRAQSSTAGTVLGGLSSLATIGTIGIPLLGGTVLGAGAGSLRNMADEDDAEVMRLAAEANAYRRRIAASKTHDQVRKILAKDPKKYVLIG